MIVSRRAAFGLASGCTSRLCFSGSRSPGGACVVVGAYRLQSHATSSESVMNVFDRNAKRWQKNRTAMLKDYKVYDYVKEEIGWRVFDRICDVKRRFGVALDLGCGRGYVSRHVTSAQELVDKVYMCDAAEAILGQAETPDIPHSLMCCDEERLPFESNSLDLAYSSLSLHWVNDLPSTLRQVFNALKSDGVFIASMFGGDTLYQLRVALQLAETERTGKLRPHISPFTDVRDLGNLLTRTGYTMLTIDSDEMRVNYPDIYALMFDLQGMGESNCGWKRPLTIGRDTLLAAEAIYRVMYGNPDGSIPATYQILSFIGWKPDPSQPVAAKRGSGQVSLKDLGSVANSR